MMKHSRHLPILLSVFLLASGLQAALVLTIDTANEDFWFSGTDTGNLGGLTSDVVWSDTLSTAAGTAEEVAYATAVVTDTGSTAWTFDDVFVARVTGDLASTSIAIRGSNFNGGEVTLAGAGESVKVDYSAMDPLIKSNFEGLIGSSLALRPQSGGSFTPADLSGANWANLEIVAVPEPRLFAMGLGVAALLLVTGRRLRLRS